MWTSLEHGLKLAVWMLSLKKKKGEKKNIKYLQQSEWSSYCKKQNFCIETRGTFMHSINVIHLTKTHFLTLQPSKNIYCHCLCKLEILNISQCILIAQKRIYHVWQQTLSIRAERDKLSSDLTGRKLDALFWLSPLRENGVSWSEIRTCKMSLPNSTVFQIQKELLGLCIWLLRCWHRQHVPE